MLAIFVALSLACAAYAAPMEAQVKSVEGWAEYALPGEDVFQPLRPTTKLPHGSRVRTAEGATVIVRVVPGAAMKIAENTTVTIDGMEFEKQGDQVKKRKARISLDAGTVSALLDHRDPEATDFRIETPQGSAAARGTFYGVSVVDGQTFVSVKEGKVGVARKEADTSEAKPEAQPES